MSKDVEMTVDGSRFKTRGRAAISNRAGRFERYATTLEVEASDHGQVVPTEVRLERPKSALSWNSSPDLPFDRSVNPYRGCEHGCIYCFARPGHAWLGLSPGLDFETRLIARPGIHEVLEKELRARRYAPQPIAIGTYTDPYQPIEKEHEIMRNLLLVLERFRHPVAIVTKGTLIERDIDILSRMAKLGLVRVGVSVTSLDRGLARQMEPRVPAPERRLAVITALARAGIPARVMASPMIPGLTDHEMERILEAAAKAGATSASWIMLRLPLEVSELFQEWLSREFPDRVSKVMGKIREMHDGQDYLADWGHRMRGQGQYSELLQHRFQLALRRLGLAEKQPALRTDLFRVPARVGDQLSLF